VSALCCGLDQTVWYGGESAQKCKATLNASPQREIVKVGNKQVAAQVLPFDLTRAHELYKALLGPAEDLIKGKHLIIVPSGPLTSLPFHVLVTEPPKSAIPAKLADYRGVAWLGARQALSVLPSVASLKALRQFARTSQSAKPYLGIGNPLLDGPQTDLRWGAYYKEQADLARTRRFSQISTPRHVASARGPRSVRSFASVFRGAQADIEHVRRLSPLPETADELCEVARRLGVPESEILLGAMATEVRLKELSEQGRLADYAIVHFATHGALTGQVQGSAEPGLILKPRGYRRAVQMQIDGRRRDVDVPEQDLHHARLNTLLQQPRCVAMAQTVGTDLTLDAGGADGETERAPQRVLADRAGAAAIGCHPTRIAVGWPQPAQLAEHRIWQGHPALLVPLADHAKQSHGALDVADLDLGRFADAQTTGIHQSKRSSMDRVAHLREDGPSLVMGEHGRQAVLAGRADAFFWEDSGQSRSSVRA